LAEKTKEGLLVMLKKYLNELQSTINKGDAREESYYKHLEDLISNLPTPVNQKISITTLPKRPKPVIPIFAFGTVKPYYRLH